MGLVMLTGLVNLTLEEVHEGIVSSLALILFLGLANVNLLLLDLQLKQNFAV